MPLNAASRDTAAFRYDLPGEARTFDGCKYDPRANRWYLEDLTFSLTVDFDTLAAQGLNFQLLQTYKAVSMARLRSHKLRSGIVLKKEIGYLLQHIVVCDPGATEITARHLIMYQESLPKSLFYRPTFINLWVRYWARLGIPGIAPDALIHAEESERKHNATGHAVRTRCPIHGPYTSLEFDGLLRALHAAFALGTITLYDYSLCLLSFSFGLRPSQIALLEICDFQYAEAEDGARKRILSVPRVKQRGKKPREEFTPRPLDSDLALVLERQIAAVLETSHETQLNRQELAMFPATYKGQKRRKNNHSTSSNVARRIIKALEKL